MIVTANITLTYPMVGEYFPVNAGGGSGDNGITVMGTSRVANTSSQLPITGKKATDEDGNRYCTKNVSKATLMFSQIGLNSNEDSNLQLGINPSEEGITSENAIYTRADYDYSGLDSETLKKADSIRYRMELFQKQPDGSYNESNPL